MSRLLSRETLAFTATGPLSPAVRGREWFLSGMDFSGEVLLPGFGNLARWHQTSLGVSRFCWSSSEAFSKHFKAYYCTCRTCIDIILSTTFFLAQRSRVKVFLQKALSDIPATAAAGKSTLAVHEERPHQGILGFLTPKRTNLNVSLCRNCS